MAEKISPEIVITSHTAADHDALSSMVAAGRLYPGAVLVAPSRQEREGINYFLDSISYLFNFVQPRDCDFSKVKTLVLVDVRQRSRVPHVAEILNSPELEVHCYDHHPDSGEDVPAAVSVVKPWGSTTAILIDLIRQKGLDLDTEEATMLGLGIYEDTGSFTFLSTTEHDLEAAAWLVTRHMDLSVISDLMSRELTAEQVSILNLMLENAVTREIRNIPIVVTEVSLEEYVNDISSLVHKMMDIGNIKVVFALARMGDRVQVVARSRIPDEVDVRLICEAMGGGGHNYAAAASVKDKTFNEVKDELFALLLSTVHAEVLVADKMTSPAKVVVDSQTMAQAEEIMTRYGLKAAPVVAAGGLRCVGYLEQQTAARAIAHGLGNRPVTDYMHGKASTVSPDSNLYPAMEIILSQRQRLVPVVRDDQVVGVLTRTDVVRILLDDTLRIPEGTPLGSAHRERNIKSLIFERLPGAHVRLLQLAGKLGEELGVAVYAVGGFVRDLLLYQNNLDIDLTVEGDGIAFAEVLAVRLGGRIRQHRKFRTAIVIFSNEQGEEQRIDVATARLEYYEYPGALPTVELSSLKMDLYRRDFTINALAVQLNPGRFGVLVDPFGAQRDMKEKSIRILHSLSFVEDPTRILRAVRFEQRFNFRIGQHTEKLIKNCLQLGIPEKLSGVRIFNELKHVFDEKNPVACLRRLDELEVLKAIHEQLRITPAKENLLANVMEVISWYRLLYLRDTPRNWAVYMLALCPNAKYMEMSSVLERLGFIERERNDFLRMRENTREAEGKLTLWLAQKSGMGRLYSMLSPLPLEGILYLMAKYNEKNIKKEISNFLSRLKNIKLDIDGEDLKKLGEPAGPAMGRILKRLLEAKADGEARDRQEQLAMARKLIAEKKADE